MKSLYNSGKFFILCVKGYGLPYECFPCLSFLLISAFSGKIRMTCLQFFLTKF